MREKDDGAAAPVPTLRGLDRGDAALVCLALALHDADDPDIAARISEAQRAGVAPAWLEETVLMTVLFLGFPRALVAARLLRRTQALAEGEDAVDYDQWRAWAARGEATCRAVYGDHYEKLRPHVAELHPALDRWVIVDGYGRTLGRPALDLARRELCAVGMLIPQRVPRQLHSHLRGALNVGARREQVEDVLDIAAADGLVPPARSATARRLWQDILTKTGS